MYLITRHNKLWSQTADQTVIQNFNHNWSYYGYYAITHYTHETYNKVVFILNMDIAYNIYFHMNGTQKNVFHVITKDKMPTSFDISYYFQ